MVDMERVQQRVLRGLYAGAGAVASGAVGNFLANQLNSDAQVGVGTVAAGAALSVGVDEVFSSPNSFPNDALEYAGYGMQAVGWDQVAEAMDISIGGAAQSRTVNLRSNPNTGVSISRSQNGTSGRPTEEFQADVA